MSEQSTNAARQQPKNLPLLQKDVTDSVMMRVKELEETGGLMFPANYSAANQIKAAWFVLQETKDRNGKPALEVCNKSSIANAVLDMVIQGLSVSKKQGYFIVYGDKLEFQRSYFGTVALARLCGMKGLPVANIIYEGDEFIHRIDVETGLVYIVKHEQKFDNIDISKIKGAYAIVTQPDGQKQVTIMSISQIKSAWGQGATKGSSPAHKNFTDEMAKKTVIGRACKMIINSSDDAYLFEGKNDEFDKPDSLEIRESLKNRKKEDVGELDDYEDVSDINQVAVNPTKIQENIGQKPSGELPLGENPPY